MITKLIPNEIGCLDKRTGRFNPSARVLRIETHPPGTHAGPIRSDVTAVEIVTDTGVRWYGCARAWITAGLRMAIELLPGQERDEVIARWEDEA
jgi:hypothetical protein